MNPLITEDEEMKLNTKNIKPLTDFYGVKHE